MFLFIDYIPNVTFSFLPDPKDGSLYAFSDGRDGIKKLPFTIPELVTASPCKSAEGILYSGMTLKVKASSFG
ncbi:hypothetical protein DPMN_025419 [Dreissena polymorpha]|uniref:Uncharacterized protein n=1 Tax=Dreissena polymorpha TaxID=45954 RepID=A0A9D4LRH1_DREPO|nr:hypothetical protein DPMN_025394 [Dreissena polymorpha]KAH3862452.1 hypothetical protein DPMN_025419 [Dreissena polymorpha]